MIKGILIDISGTLIEDGRPLPDSVEWLNQIIEADFPFLLLTNTTVKTRKDLYFELTSVGFKISKSHIINPEIIAYNYVKRNYPQKKIRNLIPQHELDWSIFITDDDKPDIILLGDQGNDFDRNLLDDLMNQMLNGAELVALHKSKYWREEKRLKVDLGGFVALLEFSTGKKAEIIGKPSPTFFLEACRKISIAPASTLMVGDDMYSDILAARKAGLNASIVKTGKFISENLAMAEKENIEVYENISKVNI